MNIEHQKSMAPKENARATYSKNITFLDVRDENIMVEKYEDEDKEYENTKRVPEEDDEYKEEEEDK